MRMPQIGDEILLMVGENRAEEAVVTAVCNDLGHVDLAITHDRVLGWRIEKDGSRTPIYSKGMVYRGVHPEWDRKELYTPKSNWVHWRWPD